MNFPSFERFFTIAHGAPPYPWQTRLVNQVLSQGCWPDTLDLPTGTGKTSAIAIALYALLRSAHAGDVGAFARRIFLVVDRRVLVDQAWGYGVRILERIEHEPELAQMRNVLSQLSSEPASSIRLRGACPTDPQWCRASDQVQIVASTVDQVASRLLLRGYGASPSMRPVEAGLVGQDSLLLLDEAHLAGPFVETVGNLRRLEPVRALPIRCQVVRLSATAGETATGSCFNLDHEDRRHPVLARRLDAPKRLRWSDANLARELKDIDAPAVLLVANTVRTALEWWKAVKSSTRPAFLVTGRARPLDRQGVVAAIEARLANREPVLVVATQCVEVGVDWDFDALITESASWDSLVQRLGRLNRRGERERAQCAVLQARRTFKTRGGDTKLCPIYREEEAATAAWLTGARELECSPGALPTPPPGCVRPPAIAPILQAEYLDLWSQNRADGPAFDVSVFAHGVHDETGVGVVWRDLDLAADRQVIESLLTALPPSSMEAASVPVHEFRQWLGDREAILAGPEIRVATADDILPGSTVVVPCSYGGLGDHGTFDGSAQEASDISREALRENHGLEFQFHDAPPIDDEESIEDQVKTWVAERESRSGLPRWTWVDAGRRWLFVSSLPVDGGDDGRSFRGRPISLADHLNGVAARTHDTAKNLGLPQELVEDLELAARLHDLGKLDDRFQGLCGRNGPSAPLAKSAFGWTNRNRRNEVIDYPRGERHEAFSVGLMARHGLHRSAHDPELVEHLVASHHGWGRPFVPSARGAARFRDDLLGQTFDSEIVHEEAQRSPSRFRAVQERYGWLGLAWLEAILRLSDHRQSEAEEMGGVPHLEERPLSSGPAIESTTMASREVQLETFNGFVASDYFASLGVLHALDIAGEKAFLRWEGARPWLRVDRTFDELIDLIVAARCRFSGKWPADLNKLSYDQCEDLLRSAPEPFRRLVVALISPHGRSEMDFVSGGRGSFKATFEWATTDRASFSTPGLRTTLAGPRTLVKDKKSFRWAPLAAQDARRPTVASSDQRSEPWLEWLAVLGISALVAVPSVSRGGRPGTRSTAVYGLRGGARILRWPLWIHPLVWKDVRAALAATSTSLRDARWCEADRLVFGTDKNRVYGLGPGRPVPVGASR